MLGELTGADILPGDLLLVHGHQWIDRQIQRISHSEYSHVAIFTGENELLEAQVFRKVGYQDAGVYAGISDVFRCDRLTPQYRTRIVNTAKSYIGRHYDYGLIVIEAVRYTTGIILPWYEFGSVICSSFAAGCFRTWGFEPCPGLRYPSPGDLAISPLFRRLGAFT